jgi:hypothetical protein
MSADSLCHVFVSMFGESIVCLDNNLFPNASTFIANVAESTVPPHQVEKELRKTVGSIIFELAMDAEATAGFGPRTMKEELQEGLKFLPECHNDLEYGFVSRRRVRVQEGV